MQTPNISIFSMRVWVCGKQRVCSPDCVFACVCLCKQRVRAKQNKRRKRHKNQRLPLFVHYLPFFVSSVSIRCASFVDFTIWKSSLVAVDNLIQLIIVNNNNNNRYQHVAAIRCRIPKNHRWREGEPGKGKGHQWRVPLQNHQGRQSGQRVE